MAEHTGMGRITHLGSLDIGAFKAIGDTVGTAVVGHLRAIAWWWERGEAEVNASSSYERLASSVSGESTKGNLQRTAGHECGGSALSI